MLTRIRGAVIASLALATSLLAAQDPVTFKASLEPATVAPNQVAMVVVQATIAEGWYLYSQTEVQNGPVPTTFRNVDGSPLQVLGRADEGTPIKKLDPNFGIEVFKFEKANTFRVPVRVSRTQVAGTSEAKIAIRFQACDDSSCLPPTTVDIPVTLTVAGAALADSDPRAAAPTTVSQPTPTPAPPATSESVSPQQRLESAKQQGLLAFVLLSVSFGLISLLTPCVFPMIPITVSFFAKRREQDGVGSSVAQAAAYSLGIIGTFTAIGVFVAGVFGASGLQSLATNPYMNLALAVLFVALALNLWGVFEIQLPGGLANKVNPRGKGKFVAPILMALAFTLTSFTCTLPFVGTLLVTASQGDFLYPIVGMLGFSTAFATPFFLLALFPGAIAKLPKSGSWMVVVKAFMGFLEIAAVVKFVSNADLVWQLGLLTRPVFLALWGATMLVAGLYMMGWVRLPKVEDGRVGPLRAGFGLASLACAGWFFFSINGRPLGELDAFLPPVPYPGQEGSAMAQGEGRWISTFEEAKKLAAAENKPIFIDFTGVTCTNCRWMEKNMFPRPNVVQRFEKYVLVKLYTDRETAADRENQKFQKELTGSVTLPIYVTMTSAGQKVQILEGSTRNEEEFTRFLDSALVAPVASR
jgi:thiol:disulfide interchange protein DsbD